MTDVCLVPVNKLLLPIAIVAALMISSRSVLADATPTRTSIQSATLDAKANENSGPSKESPALQQSTSLDPAAATQAWLNSVPQDKRDKSDAYFEGGYWLLLWNYLVAAAISILLLSSRISERLRDLSERLTRYKTLQVACYSISYLLLAFLLSFPLNIYEHFFREHQYGLATQNFPAWFREQLVGLGITLVGGTIFFIVLYAIFRRAPKTWWIWGTGVAVAFSFFVLFIAPVFIEPLFNTYKPLTKPEISEPILVMARANEIPVKQVFEVDASRQTTRVSANVSGILGTTRIALNDNLLNQCTVPEIRAVMAHEMGHYVLNHGAKLLTYLAVSILVGFGLTRILFDAALRRWGDRWGVRGIADPAGLPLLALIFCTLLFLATPLLNTLVRVTEREADAFGINTAREPDAMAEVALKLGVYRKLNPTPLEEFIFFDHPSGRARIRMAMDWKAANLPAGENPKSESQNPKQTLE
ncbi:MAG TPA: M48 family metallopeptidase [Candidatus Udaeobacter sp.]|nr:M48 family metallopeptidase [Candidatus Udaeobacter sp.]